MIAVTSLKRIVQDERCYDPAAILKRLNFLVKTALQQGTQYALSDDGLDASICWVDPMSRLLSFAGAKLPLYYVSPDHQVEMVKRDKQNLGYKRSDLNLLIKILLSSRACVFIWPPMVLLISWGERNVFHLGINVLKSYC